MAKIDSILNLFMQKVWFLALLFAFSCGSNDHSVVAPDERNILEIHTGELAASDSVQNIPNQFPIPNGWINDYEQVLTEEQADSLDRMISRHHENYGNEIYIVTTNDPTPYPNLTDYTVALGMSWNASQDSTISSILMVVCMPCQELRIESSDAQGIPYSQEQQSEVIFEVMMPRFAQGEFFTAFESGLITTINYLENHPNAKLLHSPN